MGVLISIPVTHADSNKDVSMCRSWKRKHRLIMTQEEDDGVMATVKWLIRNQESGSESQCCPTMARSAS